jgi:hypothetical protein
MRKRLSVCDQFGVMLASVIMNVPTYFLLLFIASYGFPEHKWEALLGLVFLHIETSIMMVSEQETQL